MADTDPGRSSTPQRQSPSPARSGRGSGDPTEQPGQVPADIFGFSVPTSTGAPGTKGATGPAADVTIQAGQLEEGLSGVTGSEITSTGLDGSQGARPSGGGESVRYTDPFGVIGGGGDMDTTNGTVSGPGDWTAQGEDNGFSGPTLPVLEGNRPTSTGAGTGSVRGAGNPNAMGTGAEPRPAGNPNAGH